MLRWSSILYLSITVLLVAIVFFLPSVYDLGGFSKVYDLYELVGSEFSFSSPRSIVTQYYPSPNLQVLTNVTYSVNASTNKILLKVNNIDYTFSLEDPLTKPIVIPILLGERSSI